MIYAVLFLLSFGLTYFIKEYALKKSLVATVNERSSHETPTPHGGGIAISISWFWGLAYLFACKEIDPQLFKALLVGIVLSVVGFVDDVCELGAKKRLLIQALVGVFGLYFLGGLSKIDFGVLVIENQIATNTLAFIGIIWFINLYNFLDGIDGYAGSEAVFLSVAGWLLLGGSYFLVLVFCVFGFLVWNWHKAKIFMGDVGSTLLGYNIAIFAIYSQNNGTSLLVWLIFFGLFWFDATITLFRRYNNSEKLSMAHKKHAYQRLTQSGWNHEKVVIFSIVINMVLLFLGYIAFVFQGLAMICFIMTIIFLYGVIKWIDTKKRFE